jgi:hypothetical protein
MPGNKVGYKGGRRDSRQPAHLISVISNSTHEESRLKRSNISCHREWSWGIKVMKVHA